MTLEKNQNSFPCILGTSHPPCSSSISVSCCALCLAGYLYPILHTGCRFLEYIPSFFLLWGICVCLYIVVGCTLCPQLIPAGSCSSSRRLFPDHHIPRKWSSVLCLFPLSLFLVLFVAFLTSCNHLIFLVYFLSLLLNSSSIRTWIIFTATSLALRRMPDA